MKNLTAARDAVGSEEPIATGGWSFLNGEFSGIGEINGIHAFNAINEITEMNELNKGGLRELINEINEINELNKARLRQLVDMLFSRWCV